MRIPLLCLAVVSPLCALDTLLAPPIFNPSNYERVPLGHYGALEGGAFVARVGGAEAAWYNPAGLSHVGTQKISANGSLFMVTDVKVSAGGESQGTNTFDQVPIFIGSSTRLSSIEREEGWFLGLSAASPNSWSQSFSANPRFTLIDDDSGIEFNNFVVYDSRSSAQGIVPAISLAYDSGGSWRIGGALESGYQSFNTRVNYGQYLENDELTVSGSYLTTSEFNVNVIGLRAVIAGQYELNEHWRFGGKLATPFAVLSSEGLITYQLTQDVNINLPDVYTRNEHVELVFRDDSPTVNVKTPWELHLGGAYVSELWQLECDLRYYGRISSFRSLESDQQVSILTVVDGTATRSEDSWAAGSEKRDAVVNVGLGGRVRAGEGLWVHGGFHTDFTPRSSDESVIEVDLYHLVGGVSWVREHIVTSLGLELSFGSEEENRTTTIVGEIDDKAKVAYNSLGFLFATTFVF